MEKEPIRILQIVTNLKVGNGVMSVVLGWHAHLDTSKYQFDYLYFDEVSISHKETISKYGGKCYYLPYRDKNSLKFLCAVYKFFKTHRYEIIHCHMPRSNTFIYLFAKWFGVKYRIQHAHLTQWSKTKLGKVRNYLLLHTLITHRVGCSYEAGKGYFGRDFVVVNNGIELTKFSYNPAMRATKRKELGLDDKFVIGNVGRFVAQKNHSFLIDVFAEVAARDHSACLVLVGSGVLEEQIKKQVAAQNLQGKVLFLGQRRDVDDLLQAFDVLCFPSIIEGLPVVGVEAQAAGLPCVFSDAITPEILLLVSSRMLSLKKSPEEWAEALLALRGQPRLRTDTVQKLKEFDILYTSQQMYDVYSKLGESLYA